MFKKVIFLILILFLITISSAITMEEIKTDCSILTNINAIDYSIYALLEGRANGQQLAGGNLANDDLILNGTSHATKTSSYIFLNAVGGNVSIGYPYPPEGTLHIYSTPDNKKASLILETYDFSVTPQERGGKLMGSPSYNGLILTSIVGDTASHIYYGFYDAFVDTHHFLVNGVEKMTINSDGNVSIGTASSTAQLDTTGTWRGRIFGVGVLNTDALGNFYVISDEKLKTNIQPYTSSISKLMNINPISFKFKPESGLDTENIYYGLSAENVQSTIPEIVYSKLEENYITKSVWNNNTRQYESITEITPKLDKNGDKIYTLSIDRNGLIDVMINAIKDQQKEIDDLELRLSRLEGVKT